MKLQIKYTSQLATFADMMEEEWQTNNKLNIRQLIDQIVKDKNDQFKSLLLDEKNQVRPSILLIINGSQVNSDSPTLLEDGDEILFFSPMSGGSI